MRITILTLFPEMFDGFINASIVKRAVDQGQVEFNIVNFRDYTLNKQGKVDDYPYGGGAGLVLSCQPILDALKVHKNENSYVLLTSPNGTKFDQAMAHRLSEKEDLVFLCGHYEGFDERITEYVDEGVCIGDYVLTGGELASMVVSDAVIRLLKDVITDESTVEESFENGLLEYPQYTRPEEYEGKRVPEVLLSGHHENIRKWRLKQSLKRTKTYRPDLLENRSFTKEEQRMLDDLNDES